MREPYERRLLAMLVTLVIAGVISYIPTPEAGNLGTALVKCAMLGAAVLFSWLA
jgi:hypothetical protein